MRLDRIAASIQASKRESVMRKQFAAVAMATFFAGVAASGAWADDIITKIQKSGVLRVGVAPSPPDQSPNPDTGNYEGYNIDMGNQIAKILNVKLEVVPATWATLVSGLGANQYDMILSNLKTCRVEKFPRGLVPLRLRGRRVRCRSRSRSPSSVYRRDNRCDSICHA